MDGWIKIHRKIWENPRSRDPEWGWVWFYLLSNVVWEPTDVVFKGKRVTLQAGQMTTGRDSIAKVTGVNRNKVDRILKTLKSEQQIEQQVSNKCRLITINNWTMYQQIEQQSEQQLSNKRATSEQQLSTNKEYKEIKNIRNINADDTYFETFKTLCEKRGLTIKTTKIRYLELREEYLHKVIFWEEVKNCLAWCHDKNKKGIDIRRLRNWMNNAIKFKKEDDLKQKQKSQESPLEKKVSVSTKLGKLWQAPL